jgi:predicted enzyme related to lactoylglutathione lyase
MSLSLSTVMINTEDTARLVDFYRQALGEPRFEGNGYTGWLAGAGFLMIGPHSEVKGTNEMPGRIMVNFETPDVAAEFERLRGIGAQVIAEPYQPGDDAGDMWLATLADPDGNYFQIASPMGDPAAM